MNMSRRLVLLVLMGTFAWTAACDDADENTQPLNDTLDDTNQTSDSTSSDGQDATNREDDEAWQAALALVEARANVLGIPGVGLAVVIDGKLAYSSGLGERSAGSGQPVTGDTLFRSSSAATKPMIALALLDLAEEGRVDLLAPVTDLVPTAQFDPAYTSEINLDRLLLQRSGVYSIEYRRGCAADTAGILKFFESKGVLPSIAPPDAIWEYTALGSIVGAAAIEAVEGVRFTEALQARVLTPAGMTTSTFDPAEAILREHADGHVRGAPRAPDTALELKCDEGIASAGLFASAADHGRFLELLLTPGRILDAASLEALQGADHNPGFGALWSYGYQAYGLEYKGERVFHHYGTSAGYTSGISWVPTRGFGVVLLTNIDGAADYRVLYAIEELRWQIIDLFLKLPGDPPDNTTPPSAWAQYEGTYAAADAPDTRFVFTRDTNGQLLVSIEPGNQTPITLTQGTIDSPYQGGDVFSYIDDSSYFLVGFFADSTGTITYANIYSDVAGHVVAQRTTE